MNKIIIRRSITVVSFLILLGILWMNRVTFTAGIQELASAKLVFVIAATIAALLSVIPGAGMYQLLTTKKLAYRKTLLVQMANNFTGKILPAGTGNMATMARYLTTQSYNVVEASSIVSVNYLTSFLGLIGLIMTSLFISGNSVTDIVKINVAPVFYLVVIIIVGSLLLAAFIPSAKSIVRKKAREFWRVYLGAISHGWRFLGAIILAASLTLTLTVCLMLSVGAFGGDISFIQGLIVLTVGVAAAAITPTPGSLGGAELGIMFALQAAGIDGLIALPAALIYRFATYWFPILPGFIAFQIALKKHYL